MDLVKSKLRKSAVVAAAMGAIVYGSHNVASAEASYKFGKGVTVETADGNNKVNISGRIQTRYTYNLLPDDGEQDSHTFETKRAKLAFKGHVYNPAFNYKFQVNFTGSAPKIEDAYADYQPMDAFGIQVGQFKVPFTKQELTSSGKQQFVDRGLANEAFNYDRDLGVNLHGTLGELNFGYNVFVVQGAGANNTNGAGDSADLDLAYGVRFELPLLGEYEDSESDVGFSTEPQFGLGLAYLYDESDTNRNNLGVDTKLHNATFDLGYKYMGISAIGAAYFQGAAEDIAGEKPMHIGFLGQVGYFFIPNKFEVALRGSGVYFDDAEFDLYEYAASFNYFISGHALKWQTDLAYLMNQQGVEDADNWQIRSQLQFIF